MVVQGYSFLQKSILKTEEQFTMMQKIDIASFYLRQDIQSSGYRGDRSCDNTLLDLDHTKNKPTIFTAEQIVFTRAIEFGVYIRDLPSKLEKKLMQRKLKYNTDILFIKDIPKEVYSLKSSMLDPCAVLHIINGMDLTAGDKMAVADAKSIDRFVASRIIVGEQVYHQLPENSRACLHKAYSKEAEVIALQQVAYYVAKANINEATYTLYRDDLTNQAEGIIEGVEDFYIKLITTNLNLVGVEISLLLRSDNKFFKPQEILWRGVAHTFTDGFLRRPFVFMVALRNVC